MLSCKTLQHLSTVDLGIGVDICRPYPNVHQGGEVNQPSTEAVNTAQWKQSASGKLPFGYRAHDKHSIFDDFYCSHTFCFIIFFLKVSIYTFFKSSDPADFSLFLYHTMIVLGYCWYKNQLL